MDSDLGLPCKQVGLSVWMNFWLSDLGHLIQAIVSIHSVKHPCTEPHMSKQVTEEVCTLVLQ